MKPEELVLVGMFSEKHPRATQMQNIGKAITSLQPEVFHGVPAVVFRVARRFFIEQAGILDREILHDILIKKGVPKDVVLESVKLLTWAKGQEVNPEKYKYAIGELRAEWRQKKFMEGLVDTMTALTEEGMKEGREVYKGYAGARVFLNRRLAELDRATGEGCAIDIRNQDEETRKLDALKEKAAPTKRILTGIKVYDQVIGGTSLGEFELVVGYSSEGKSMLTTNMIWSRVVNQGLNCLVFVGEMALPQYRRRILCRHSHLKQFGFEAGADYNRVKWEQVVKDFEINPEYGKCILIPIPRGGTVDYIQAMSNQYGSLFDVEVIVVDRVELVTASRRRTTDREELGEVIRDLRHLALDFSGGKGVLLQAVGQTSRESWKLAKKQGFYLLSASAECAEFEKSPDVVIWVLAPEEEGTNKIRTGVTKNRDGRKIKNADLHEDFATSYVGDVIKIKRKTVL